ncbi:putative Ty3/Gypsy polyprotein/retrotransposon, partial [Trifolium medium]|nr:putative Ty3/Gypsy polyprotein/retrotransposon [Trifolium medium]
DYGRKNEHTYCGGVGYISGIMARDHLPGREDEARLEHFMKHKPPTFTGGYNPEGAVKLLEEVEIIFEAMRCTEEDKTS